MSPSEAPAGATATPPSRPAPAPPTGRGMAVRLVLYLGGFELLVGEVLVAAATGVQGMPSAVLVVVAAYLAAAAVLYSVVARVPALDRRPRATAFLLAGLLTATSLAVGRPLSAALALPSAALGLALLGARLSGRPPSRTRRVLRAGFGLLVLGVLGAPLVPVPTRPPPTAVAPAGAPSVLVIVLDTLRADALGAYGQPLPTSPRLDTLARAGVRVERAYANANWTLPGHASLFTGLYPSVHGAHDEHWRLGGEPETLASLLHGAGWDTVAISGNALISDGPGLSRGFRSVWPSWRSPVFDEVFLLRKLALKLRRGDTDKGGAEAVRAFEAWLAGRDAGRPFFAFVNLFEPHTPYHRLPRRFLDRFLPEDVSAREAVAASRELISVVMLGQAPADPVRFERTVRALYLAGVAAGDEAAGRLLDALAARGLSDDTLVIVTSDHGELLGEHGLWGHDAGVWEGVIRIPFLARWPGRLPEGTVVPGPIEQVDLLPTVLDLVGRADRVPRAVAGRSRRAALVSGAPAAERHAVVAEQFTPLLKVVGMEEGTREADGGTTVDRRRAVVSGDLKYTVHSSGDEALYDLSTDPQELHDALASRGPDAETARRALRAWVDRGAGRSWADEGAPGDPDAAGWMDAGTRDLLRALGYVQ